MWPGASDADLVPGRFTGTHLGAVARGGVCLGSIYLRHGLGPRGENLKTLDLVEEWVRRVNGLWVIGGDWNMEPHLLAPWVHRMGAAIVAPSEATCKMGKGTRIDYFVVCARLAPFVRGVTVVHNGAIKTHRIVELRLAGELRQATQVVQAKPKAFPVDEPVGCRQAPRLCPPFDGSVDLSLAVARWYDIAEGELLRVFGIDEEEAPMYTGRAGGPRYRSESAIGPPGTRHQRTSPAGRAALEIECLLGEILLCSSHNHTQARSEHLHRLRRRVGLFKRQGVPSEWCERLRGVFICAATIWPA